MYNSVLNFRTKLHRIPALTTLFVLMVSSCTLLIFITMHSLHTENCKTLAVRTFILNLLWVYNATELMACRLHWCVVITEAELIRPESSLARETGTKADLSWFLSIFPFLVWYFQTTCSSMLLTASIGFCFASYPSWVFHTCKVFCPLAVPHACFALVYNLLSLGWILCATTHIFVPLVVTSLTYLMQNANISCLTRSSQSYSIFFRSNHILNTCIWGLKIQVCTKRRV